jgi:hypothetical protein
VLDPVVETDPIEEHVGGLCPQPAGEDSPVVREDLFGDAVSAQGFEQRVAHRACRRPRHHLGDDAEPGMVVDAGDDRHRDPVAEKHAAQDV